MALGNNLLDRNIEYNEYNKIVGDIINKAEIKSADISKQCSHPKDEISPSFFDDLIVLSLNINDIIKTFPEQKIETSMTSVIVNCGKLGLLEHFINSRHPSKFVENIQDALITFESNIKDTSTPNLDNSAAMVIRTHSFFVNRNISSYRPSFGHICADGTFWEIQCYDDYNKLYQHTNFLIDGFSTAKNIGNLYRSNLTKIGIYNPRTDTAYTINTFKIDYDDRRRREYCRAGLIKYGVSPYFRR